MNLKFQIQKSKIEKNLILLTIFARHITAGKPNAETTITLVINHIKSVHGLESFKP